MKRYTVGALCFQTLVLFGLAVFAYQSSLTATRGYWGGSDSIIAAIFGVLGVVAIWLTGEHHTKTLGRRTLQIWAVICIILSLLPLFASLNGLILRYSIQSLGSLLQVVLFLIPTILILVFSSLENRKAWSPHVSIE